MARCRGFWNISTFSLYAIASGASAQIAPPVLEVDFTTGTAAIVPLSPAVSVAIAIVIAAVALFMLRRTRGGARLLLVLSAASLAHALLHTSIVSQARAAPPPPIPLPLTSSPTIVTGPSYFDYIQASNGTGSRIRIVAVKYDPGGYDYYLDTATTTCVHGLVLAPGASCLIRILSLG